MMKKALIIILILSIFILNGCENGTDLNIDVSETTIAVSTEIDREELLKSYNDTFIKELDFAQNCNLDSLIEELYNSNVKEIVQLTADKNIIKSGNSDCFVVQIKDVTDSIYYVVLTDYGYHGKVYTEKEWETLQKNALLLSKSFDFLKGCAPQYLAIDFADAGAGEIKKLNLEKETFNNEMIARAENTEDDVYYLTFGEYGTYASVYTSAEWEKIIKNVKALEKQPNLANLVDFSLDRMAEELFDAGVKEIKSVTVEDAEEDGYINVKITDSESNNYFIVFSSNYGYPANVKPIFTEYEFKLSCDYKKILSEKTDLDDYELYYFSGVFVYVGIEGIQSLEIEEDKNWVGTRYMMCVTDKTGKKYYVSFYQHTIGYITENDKDNGKMLYAEVVDDLSFAYGINAKDHLGHSLG